MSQVKNFLTITLMVFGLISCQKDESNNKMSGTWEGFWGFDFETPDVYERWDLKDNGTMGVYNGSGTLIATGSWQVSGFNFDAEYTTVTSHHTYLFEGLYSDAAGEITGNWGQKPSSTNGGTFEMQREQ